MAPRQSFYDDIEIEDFTWDPSANVYHYPCPCGDRFEITKSQLRDGDEVARCGSCSLIVRVVYEWDDFEDYDSDDEIASSPVMHPTTSSPSSTPVAPVAAVAELSLSATQPEDVEADATATATLGKPANKDKDTGEPRAGRVEIGHDDDPVSSKPPGTGKVRIGKEVGEDIEALE